MRDTRSVVAEYLEGLAAGDLDAVSAQFADDVLLLTPDGAIRGIRAMTRECELNLSGVFAPGTYTRVTDSLVVAGETALLTWHACCLGTVIPHAVTTFIVRDGRIAAVTSVVQIEEI